MKFLIISDIHDNLVNLEKCVNWGRAQAIENAICPGDVVNSETLAYLSENFKVIYLVRGNMEIYDETEVKKYNNINYLGRFGAFEINGKSIGLCHEPWYIKSVLDKKAPSTSSPRPELGTKAEQACKIIFYGHTHEPWISEKDGVITANPGTLGGVFTKASFAVYDSESGQLELKVLELL